MATIMEQLAADLLVTVLAGGDDGGLARDISYTAEKQAAKVIKAVVLPMFRDHIEVGNNQHSINEMRILISTDPAAGVAMPSQHDSQVIDDREFGVSRIEEIGPGWAILLITNESRNRLSGSQTQMIVNR